MGSMDGVLLYVFYYFLISPHSVVMQFFCGVTFLTDNMADVYIISWWKMISFILLFMTLVSSSYFHYKLDTLINMYNSILNALDLFGHMAELHSYMSKYYVGLLHPKYMSCDLKMVNYSEMPAWFNISMEIFQGFSIMSLYTFFFFSTYLVYFKLNHKQSDHVSVLMFMNLLCSVYLSTCFYFMMGLEHIPPTIYFLSSLHFYSYLLLWITTIFMFSLLVVESKTLFSNKNFVPKTYNIDLMYEFFVKINHIHLQYLFMTFINMYFNFGIESMCTHLVWFVMSCYYFFDTFKRIYKYYKS